MFLSNNNSNVSAILTDIVCSFISENCTIIYNAVIQKHTAEIAESGVITYFSFLLLEIKFIIVLNDKYVAITIQIIFVVLSENHKGINPPNGKPQMIRILRSILSLHRF